MAQKGSRRKGKTRRKSEAEEAEASTLTLAPEVSPIPEAIRDEMTTLIQELLLKTHELSFEYATSDCEELLDCPLARKAKDVFKVVKKLNELVRESLTGSAKPTYVK